MIVGSKENQLLQMNLEVEVNHIKFSVKKGVLGKTINFINNFNEIDWDTKSSNVLNVTEEDDEDRLRSVISDYVIESTNLDDITIEDFNFSDESVSNIREYKGESIDIVDNLQYFADTVLPQEVMDMIKTYKENIQEIDITEELGNLVNGIHEYVIYMGPNKKYRGCMGKIVKQREDTASELVEFPNKFRESGRIARFWSKPSNLVFLNNEEN